MISEVNYRRLKCEDFATLVPCQNNQSLKTESRHLVDLTRKCATKRECYAERLSHVTDISLTRNFRLARQAYIANQGEYYPPVRSIHDFPRLGMSDDSQRIETVLAVDSDEDNLCLLKSILGMKGLDVLTAVNGEEAVDLAVRWRPELILIDLKLPIISGFSAVRRIRKLPSLGHVPIISFAPGKPTCHREIALAAGCAAHLDKPIDFDELDLLIDRFLPGHSLELASVLVH